MIKDDAVHQGTCPQHIEEGALTADYKADRDTVIKLLNEALATEIVCVLRVQAALFYGAEG